MPPVTAVVVAIKAPELLYTLISIETPSKASFPLFLTVPVILLFPLTSLLKPSVFLLIVRSPKLISFAAWFPALSLKQPTFEITQIKAMSASFFMELSSDRACGNIDKINATPKLGTATLNKKQLLW